MHVSSMRMTTLYFGEQFCFCVYCVTNLWNKGFIITDVLSEMANFTEVNNFEGI